MSTASWKCVANAPRAVPPAGCLRAHRCCRRERVAPAPPCGSRRTAVDARDFGVPRHHPRAREHRPGARAATGRAGHAGGNPARGGRDAGRDGLIRRHPGVRNREPFRMPPLVELRSKHDCNLTNPHVRHPVPNTNGDCDRLSRASLDARVEYRTRFPGIRSATLDSIQDS